MLWNKLSKGDERLLQEKFNTVNQEIKILESGKASIPCSWIAKVDYETVVLPKVI